MRIVFFGTPAFAVPTLTEIVGQGHEVVAVYSRPPRAAGRGLSLRKSPVHETAERFGIPVETPRSLRDDEASARFADIAPDVGIVVAYGLILPAPILDTPPEGCLNLHASLLPRWRGAAPIARAIMAGDSETGVMVMRMEQGLDTGPVAMAERVPIGADATAGELSEQLSRLGADLMVRALAALSRGGLETVPQAEEGVTYASKIDKAETRIDWSRPAEEVHNHIRGLSPEPGAWFEGKFGRNPERIKVLRSAPADGSGAPGTVLDELTIACGRGAVRLIDLQRAGRQPIKADAFLRGVRDLPASVA
ncbi:MAG: methionyl-tRNA formyltransferase [Bauldia sp.]|uniref:methionyl-tRNA formyltransferase n=1 Tax=Bauldia sp. TaxID=2575872 RepID=UPI001D2BEAB1|nr:methionyl-tRNA formyltransferase [Bauldia sp.]MCB1496668.1 methionyl-tRNA formyltransferase [Bauldia sp.]